MRTQTSLSFRQGIKPFSLGRDFNPPNLFFSFLSFFFFKFLFLLLSCNVQYQKMLLTIQLFLFFLVSSTVRQKTALGCHHSRGVLPERAFSCERRILALCIFPPTYCQAVHSLQRFGPPGRNPRTKCWNPTRRTKNVRKIHSQTTA